MSSAYIKIVDTLLRAGASNNSIDDDGCTPLDLALQGASLHVQDALRRFGLQQRQRPRSQDESYDASSKQVGTDIPFLQEGPTVPAQSSETEPIPSSREFAAVDKQKILEGTEWNDDDDLSDLMSAFEDSQPGPLAQFLATGALLQSQGGWRQTSNADWKSTWERMTASQGGWSQSGDADLKSTWERMASDTEFKNTWGVD